MKKHVEVSAGLLFENGKLFAVKRGESPYPYLAYKYEFPGGKIEQGERGEETVKRELKEELDMDVVVGSLYACEWYEYPDFTIRLWVYECERRSSFTIKEHENYAWLAPKDLQEGDWAPADAEIVRAIKRVFGE